MTIKLVSYQRDPQNGDNIQITVDYDNPYGSGTMYQFTYDMNMATMDAMSNAQLNDDLKARVAVERGDQLWSNLDNRLSGFVNQELEP